MKAMVTKHLMDWNRKFNRRAMPWKGEKDPYKIWVSEIILQQTRVEQGWNYYLRFIAAFPTVQDLAAAAESSVFKLWEGLGYYSRCKNMIAAARKIAEEYNGYFPDKYEQILNLPGVGPYTAAAIASFAFNLPYAVVDGNVQRVVARIEGIDIPVDSARGKAWVNRLAYEWLDKKAPGLYNQAMMDFGAVICKPKSPDCSACIMQKHCRAFQTNRAALLPVREKKIVKKSRWFYYFIITCKNRVYIRKRSAKDIWQNLHEFFLVEESRALANPQWQNLPQVKPWFMQSDAKIVGISDVYTQQLTHQTVHGRFIEVKLNKAPKLGNEYKAVLYRELEQYALPKLMITYLQEKNVNLSQH